MDYFVLVQIFDSEEDLLHEVSGLGLSDGFTPLVQLHHGASSAKFEDDVDEILVLEIGEELDHVLVVERLVKCDLLGHLLSLVALDQQGFRHDLTGQDLVVVDIAKFITFSETTLKIYDLKGFRNFWTIYYLQLLKKYTF